MKQRTLIDIILWLLFVAWAGAIYYTSSLPGHEVSRLIRWDLWDKALHFVAFAIGGGLFFVALRLASSSSRASSLRILLVTILVLCVYGALDEWHQTKTPGRTGGDIDDWIADALGGSVGAAVGWLIYARTRFSRSPDATAPAAD